LDLLLDFKRQSFPEIFWITGHKNVSLAKVINSFTDEIDILHPGAKYFPERFVEEIGIRRIMPSR
jgi:hypothetical protein